jgi:peptidoglycan/LPS O-acetylase OafA/YrhL
MLQRIQSVWLFLAGALTFASIKLPFYSGTNDKGIASYELNGTENLLLLITTIAIGVLAMITIFLYTNRKLQLRLCLAGIVLQVLLHFFYYKQIQVFTQGTHALTAVLNIIAVVFFVLAARAINKDEKLIKDSDRLR